MSSKNECMENVENNDTRTSKKHSEDSKGDMEKVFLLSNDGHKFEIEVDVAMQSDMIKHAIEDACTGCIPLPNVSGTTLAKIIEYWRHHAVEVEHASEITEVEKEDLKEFDKNFVNVDDTTLVQLVTAAHYLSCKPLLDILCRAIANNVKDYTVERAREFFGINNDFTPEEEDRIRAENAWAFDP